ncbi:DUF4259 domain-containing protein [Streptomyces cucumeris]|uniref:DUF4259 domain-containing protein n=1 Tax=Streptomyces cucumeris TaxID=2962890 RepID=UPI003EBC3D7B
MGTWGTGPFDSDIAGDFVDSLAALAPEQIADTLEKALRRVVDSSTRVEGGDGSEAVAAAALIAAQVPGAGIAIDSEDELAAPLPELPCSLRELARDALRRVVQSESELATGWVDNADAAAWRQEVQLIFRALTIGRC